MKKDIRYACRVVLLGFAVLYAAEYLLAEAAMYFYLARNPLTGADELHQMLYGSGVVMILAEASAAAVICVLLGKNRKLHLFAEKREAGLRRMIVFFFCLMGLQLLVSFFAMLVEVGLNLFGYTLLEASAVASGGTRSMSMLTYSVLIAPAMEELIFRGAILHYLMPHGKRFAILFSALLFGLMHANIVQLPVAFFGGILLGYIAAEYSLPAAMVVHSLCNVSVEARSLMVRFGISGAEWMDAVILYFGIVTLISVLMKHGSTIRQYARETAGDTGCVKAVLTSVSFWIILFAMGIFTALSVAPMK